MSKVSIKIDGGAIDRAREMLSSVPGGVGKILPRAINRALTVGRAQVSKSVRENYTVAAAEIKKTLRVTKAFKSEPPSGGFFCISCFRWVDRCSE